MYLRRDKKEISFILVDKDKGKYQKGNAFQTTNSILIDRSLNFPVTFLLLELTFRPFSAVLVLSSYYSMLLMKSFGKSNYWYEKLPVDRRIRFSH